jgi:predicted phosphodiesterase
MKLVCISDTHSLHRRIPEIPHGDVLIHAGDSLGQGTLENSAARNTSAARGVRNLV